MQENARLREAVKGLEAAAEDGKLALKRTQDYYEDQLENNEYRTRYHDLKLRFRELQQQLSQSQQAQKGLKTQMLRLQTEKDRAVFASTMKEQEMKKKVLTAYQTLKIFK